jgi:hypothetical protein
LLLCDINYVVICDISFVIQCTVDKPVFLIWMCIGALGWAVLPIWKSPMSLLKCLTCNIISLCESGVWGLCVRVVVVGWVRGRKYRIWTLTLHVWRKEPHTCICNMTKIVVCVVVIMSKSLIITSNHW